MRRASLLAQRIAVDVNRQEFVSDDIRISAMAMSLQRMGEAAVVIRREFPRFSEARPHVPWAKLIGPRNIISHDYDSLEADAMWSVAKSHLAGLTEFLTPPSDDEI
jgi:uncharacterized protein with HEPN domain